jgi:AP endonuclease-1
VAPADAGAASASTSGKKARKPRAKKLTPAEQLIAGFDGAAHPYANRSHWVGYHCSAAGGLYNAVLHARATHARAFAFFTRPRGSWVCPALQEEDAAKFRAACAEHGYGREHILPHGTYLSNAGSSDPVIRGKSLDALVDEAARCAALGIGLYNFHPGSAASCAGGRDECLRNVAAAIDHVHARVPGVVMVIETMAGGGSVVCSTFEEIAAVIALVDDKGRVGVCIDTAHIHAAGYDVRTPDGYAAMMADFERVVGLRYLRGMHLNDSAASLGSKKDRHWHIGRGAVGLDAFRAIMTDARTAGIPLILETPASAKAFLPKYAAEVELLYSLDGEGASGGGASAGRGCCSSSSGTSAGSAGISASSAGSRSSSSCRDIGVAGVSSDTSDCLAAPSAAGPSGVAESAVAEAASDMLLAASIPEGSLSAAAVVEAASASLPPAAESLPLKAVAADACSAMLAAARTGSVPAATAYTPLPDFMRAIAGLSPEGVAVLAAFPAPVVLAGPAKGGSRKKAAKAGSAAAAGAGGGEDDEDEDEDGGDEEEGDDDGDE